ncbi:MAG: oligoendopeptidase F [Chloroflexota bacterium]|nr:oligoendopeptidase F [Chloroflexota bacterium]
MATAVALPKRSEVDIQDTWDLASVFPSDEAWEAALEEVAGELPGLERFRGHIGDSPQALLEWLTTVHELFARLGKVYVYAGLSHEADTADQDAAAKDDRASGLYARAAAAVAFGEPELLGIGFDTLRQWMDQEPGLRVYAHYFDQLEKRQEHVRSAEVEELLGAVRDPFGSASGIHGILADADLKFQPARDSEGTEHEVAQGTIRKLLSSTDRELRRTAWESYSDAHIANKNTMASCLATGVKQDAFLARARRYGSSLEAALAANYIPAEVYHNLLDTFRSNLPTWHRYWRVMRQALGYDKLHVYDIHAPLTQNTPNVPYDMSVDWILEGLRPLGEEYVSTSRRGLTEERWVDKYPNQGKRAGAFSSGVQGTHPFILSNFTPDMDGLSTVAHELGHSMHSYLTWQTQPPVYADYSIFVAEVASNFNQALVRAHLLETNEDRDFQLAVIDEAMGNFHRYFFLMPTLARFELELHERVERGEALTAEGMMTLMTNLFREAYGEEVEIDADRVGITWAQFPTHLYANFYVYQYATGLSGAHALAEKVLAGEPGAAENYLAFLRSGSSLYPLDALKLAGVDLSSPEPVQQTFDVLSGLVDRLERLTTQ